MEFIRNKNNVNIPIYSIQFKVTVINSKATVEKIPYSLRDIINNCLLRFPIEAWKLIHFSIIGIFVPVAAVLICIFPPREMCRFQSTQSKCATKNQ
jgi:hypothetical protein